MLNDFCPTILKGNSVMKTTSTQKRVLARMTRIAAATGCTINLYANAWKGELAVAINAPDGMFFKDSGRATTTYQWYADRSWKQLRSTVRSLTDSQSVHASIMHLVA